MSFDPNNMGGLLGGLQQQMKQMQEQAAATEVTGSAGGGLVEVVANGAQEILRVSVQDGAMDDKELLEDLIAAATNDALRKSKAVMADKLGGLAAGMGLPPGMLG